jgi:hypothetical protein
LLCQDDDGEGGGWNGGGKKENGASVGGDVLRWMSISLYLIRNEEGVASSIGDSLILMPLYHVTQIHQP